MKRFDVYCDKVNDLVEVVSLEDVKQMLRELGLEQFYLNGSETSPPIRIPHSCVKQAVQEIYMRKK